jgi:hypothetical protein
VIGLVSLCFKLLKHVLGCGANFKPPTYWTVRSKQWSGMSSHIRAARGNGPQAAPNFAKRMECGSSLPLFVWKDALSQWDPHFAMIILPPESALKELVNAISELRAFALAGRMH